MTGAPLREGREPGGTRHGLPADVLDLIVPRGPLNLPVPAYSGRSVPNVAATVVRALGAEPSGASLPPLDAALDPFAGRRAEGPVLLVLIDGLGHGRLLRSAARSPDAPAGAWRALARPITTVFPTTTTAALVSLSTASSPSRHGVVGYRQFFPRFGAVVDTLRLSPIGVTTDDALIGAEWTPGDVSGAPTVFRDGVAGAVAVSRDRFAGRGFTRLLYDGAAYAGYSAYADFAGVLAKTLGAATPPPLTVAYWDELDTTEHLQGPDAGAVDLELDRLVALFDFVARSVGTSAARRITVLLTADHGLVPTDPARQTAIDREPTILEHLARPPTGDRRVGLLRARPGGVEPLTRALRERLPAGTRIVPAEDALRAGLFGPPPYHPELAERVGDLVVLVPSPAGITYHVPGRPPPVRVLRGAHGGLEAEELVVPLVVGPLERFLR